MIAAAIGDEPSAHTWREIAGAARKTDEEELANEVTYVLRLERGEGAKTDPSVVVAPLANADVMRAARAGHALQGIG